MALIMLILSIGVMLGALACSYCAYPCMRQAAEDKSAQLRLSGSVLALVPIIGGFIGLLWCFINPPPFSVLVSGPPVHHRNDPDLSVYLGNGCFWHTQYDFVVLEQETEGAFGNRTDQEVTSLVGYAGGQYMSSGGSVCYHGLPHTDYNRLGHAEAVSIQLDGGNTTQEQLAALAQVYFEHGFQDNDGKRQRLDPQDAGAEYRNVIGLPGGMDNVELWPVVEAANVHNMPLIRAAGGSTGDDTEGEYVVYVYDSREYPFFRGEASHQFHTNDVLGREVPVEYHRGLKQVQAELGRIDDDLGCSEVPFAEISLLIVFVFALPFWLGSAFLLALLPAKLRFWERLRTSDDVRTVAP